MKINSSLAILIALIAFSCSGKSSSANEDDTTNISDSDNENRPPENGPVDPSDYANLIKEELFFFWRNVNKVRDYNVNPIYEDIFLDNDSVSYILVSINTDHLYSEQYREYVKGARFIRSRKSMDISDHYDTVRYAGKISVSSQEHDLGEHFATIVVKFEGDYYINETYYAVYEGLKRVITTNKDETELDIFIKGPTMIFNKENMYLKARLFDLLESDLADYTQEELAYLRNEIFARHGHIFKTEKMKEYFAGKDWYRGHTYDATELLNPTEKRNTQFIKRLEN